jgi:PadR family transcriptional regulator PadR
MEPGAVLQIPQGSLYRLEHQGWIRSAWGSSDNNRKAKYYSITAAGRKQLRCETGQWSKLTGAVAAVLNVMQEET